MPSRREIFGLKAYRHDAAPADLLKAMPAQWLRITSTPVAKTDFAAAARGPTGRNAAPATGTALRHSASRPALFLQGTMTPDFRNIFTITARIFDRAENRRRLLAR